MPREDKGTSSASPLKEPSGGSEPTSSLAARRARLRGTLARATTPQDQSFDLGAPTFGEDGLVAVGTASESTQPSAETQSPESNVEQLPTAGQTGSPSPTPSLPPADESSAQDPDANSQHPASVSSPFSSSSPEPTVQDQSVVTPDPSPAQDSLGASDSFPGTAEPVAVQTPEPAATQGTQDHQRLSTPAATLRDIPAGITPSPFSQEPPQSFAEAASAWGEDPPTGPSAPSGSLAAFVPSQPALPASFIQPQLPQLPQLPPLAPVPPQAVELLQSIDQAMNACATNLATLQRLSSEQTDVLKNLTSTLENQTLSQIGLNLNSLTDSLSAALEPMKAIGELVPAMDQLVSTLEQKEAMAGAEKMSPDQLVTSLADQLSAGLIDPWTFKCAYMAVYPTDHPADLLHRLVELLGTQRLSGDLFRAAYEAVQAAEPPAGRGAFSPGPLADIDPAKLDETIRQQLSELQKSNDELRKRQEEREAELQRILETKEKELAELQARMQDKHEEVSESVGKREDEYRSLLESKDMELVEKESENNMLRAQMEELRAQTEDMVKDMQKQISELKIAHEESVANQPPKPVSSFFDNAPSPARSLFDSGPQKNLFDQAQQAAGQPGQLMQPQPQSQPTQQLPAPQQPVGQATTQPMTPMAPPTPPTPQMGGLPANTGGAPPSASPVVPPSSPQPPPAPPAPPQRPQPQPNTTPFSQGQGSYGSGVRAQVFEVIVRQALAGAPWREICAGPMQVNNITPDEVEAEVKRRQALLNK